MQPISELVSDKKEAPSWISPDGCVLYFDRWEEGANGAVESTVMRAFRASP